MRVSKGPRFVRARVVLDRLGGAVRAARGVDVVPHAQHPFAQRARRRDGGDRLAYLLARDGVAVQDAAQPEPSMWSALARCSGWWGTTTSGHAVVQSLLHAAHAALADEHRGVPQHVAVRDPVVGLHLRRQRPEVDGRTRPPSDSTTCQPEPANASRALAEELGPLVHGGAERDECDRAAVRRRSHSPGSSPRHGPTNTWSSPNVSPWTWNSRGMVTTLSSPSPE